MGELTFYQDPFPVKKQAEGAPMPKEILVQYCIVGESGLKQIETAWARQGLPKLRRLLAGMELTMEDVDRGKENADTNFINGVPFSKIAIPIDACDIDSLPCTFTITQYVKEASRQGFLIGDMVEVYDSETWSPAKVIALHPVMAKRGSDWLPWEWSIMKKGNPCAGCYNSKGDGECVPDDENDGQCKNPSRSVSCQDIGPTGPSNVTFCK